ncbi:hypothetical protein ACLD0W_07865 [Alloalcanivorax sp. C16-1]|uniref:hypothetical protein n=1 Tax=Alloalcanivorax sp. C16-1 TaxID=3390051 RepID=UPI003970ADE8
MDSLIVNLRSDEQPDVSIQCDAIRMDGVICLVPEWVYSPDGRDRSPARLIRLLDLPMERVAGYRESYALNNPLPRSVLAGQVPVELDGKIEVVFVPLRFRVETPH